MFLCGPKNFDQQIWPEEIDQTFGGRVLRLTCPRFVSMRVVMYIFAGLVRLCQLARIYKNIFILFIYCPGLKIELVPTFFFSALKLRSNNSPVNFDKHFGCRISWFLFALTWNEWLCTYPQGWYYYVVLTRIYRKRSISCISCPGLKTKLMSLNVCVGFETLIQHVSWNVGRKFCHRVSRVTVFCFDSIRVLMYKCIHIYIYIISLMCVCMYDVKVPYE